MFQVTERAAEQLKRIISQRDATQNTCLRLGLTQEGLRMMADEERPGDRFLEHDGEPLFLMDSVTADLLFERKMDYDETAEQLVFT